MRDRSLYHGPNGSVSINGEVTRNFLSTSLFAKLLHDRLLSLFSARCPKDIGYMFTNFPFSSSLCPPRYFLFRAMDKKKKQKTKQNKTQSYTRVIIKEKKSFIDSCAMMNSQMALSHHVSLVRNDKKKISSTSFFIITF